MKPEEMDEKKRFLHAICDLGYFVELNQNERRVLGVLEYHAGKYSLEGKLTFETLHRASFFSQVSHTASAVRVLRKIGLLRLHKEYKRTFLYKLFIPTISYKDRMKRQQRNSREGFWYEGVGSLLPMPVARDKPWRGQTLFFEKLVEIEQIAHAHFYKGSSYCRLCDNNQNGSATFVYCGWEWPSGFYHYVTKHNVRPSLAFQEFILGGELE